MNAISPQDKPHHLASASGVSFIPLAQLLNCIDPITIIGTRRRVSTFGREELLSRYRAAFFGGHRIRAILLAEGLVGHSVPPFVWHKGLVLNDLNVNQRFDVFVVDLMWLRHQYPDHTNAVRYKRGKAMWTGGTTLFHREAEFAFYQGIRPAWKLCRSLSLTDRQQWESCYLRSTPIKKRALETEALSQQVFKALQNDLRMIRLTDTFGEPEVQATLQRRHTIWQCSRMTNGTSPSDIARIYEEVTGISITRQAVARQLEKLRGIANKSEMTHEP